MLVIVPAEVAAAVVELVWIGAGEPGIESRKTAGMVGGLPWGENSDENDSGAGPVGFINGI